MTASQHVAGARPSDVPGALVTSDARRAAAAQLRVLTESFITHEVDDGVLDSITAQLKTLNETLAASPSRLRSFEEIRRESEAEDVADGEEIGHFDLCFITGEASSMGLNALVHVDGDGLVAVTQIPRTFEGMPGYAHGGILMAIFDDLIGMTIGRLHRLSAPTVHVEVDFRRPVPLRRDVEFRTKLAAVDGRKHSVTAQATIDGELYAEAKGLLVVLASDHTIG
jgi:acyl-coenzyme A thioesterase PaaI-like protein